MAWLDRTISMTAPALRFLAQDVVHALPDALFKVGADGLIGEVLHRPAGLNGLDVVIAGRYLDEVLSDGIASRIRSLTARALQHAQVAAVRFKDADLGQPGTTCYEARCSRLSANDVLLVVRDVTDQELAASALSEQAMHDPLTGLANRPLVTDRIAQALRRAWRKGGTVAVVLIDLDHFKDVNDLLGYDAGHDVLAALAKRLVAAVRSTDTVARIGSDEFAVLIDGLDEMSEVMALTEQLRSAIEATNDGPRIESPLSACMGVAVAAGGDIDATTMLSNADTALRQAKRAGRGTTELFDPALQRALERRLDLRRALRHGLERGEMSLNYQPIYNVRTGRIAGVEAFLRWTRPGYGTIPANEFVPVAEETGMINPIGTWALRTACADAATWRRHLDVDLAVNVAPKQLLDPAFLGHLRAALSDTRLEPGALTIEVTETSLLGRNETAAENLAAIRALGVKIALDDFGTGYSSLTNLRRFPVTEIKIDRSFTAGLTINSTDERIVESTIALAHAVGYRVVAEGVETSEQLELLARLGCDEAQGYLLGAPQTASEISRLLVVEAQR
jgi:diguanylate cyclase (GGDEF)-like protein